VCGEKKRGQQERAYTEKTREKCAVTNSNGSPKTLEQSARYGEVARISQTRVEREGGVMIWQ